MGVEKTEVKESSSPHVVKSGKFLPRMVLRVLLVEADDSTRQIIAALLRKCSYRVAAVPDGLKAWETLKGRPTDIDLILTEVELPSISGYALLTLIMEHNICKNIPVIMMSSQDSISVVLKCMLRGAADFLIKPVRRNELRNLWQHVWRRQTNCQQTVGCVPKNTAVEQQKVEVTFKNNAARSHSSDHLDSTPKSKECRRKRSDAQSSCTTPCLEDESACMQNMQGVSQLKYGTDSKLSNIEKHEGYMKLVERSVMLNSETGGKSIRIEPENISCNKAYKSTAFSLGNDPVRARTVTWDSDSGLESQGGHTNNKLEIHCNAHDVADPSSEAQDLIGKFGHHPKDTNGNLSANDGTNKFSFAPELELSLRRFRPSCPKNKATDEGDILNHSNASAFSRYNNNKALRSLFPALTSNCSELTDHAATFHGGVSCHRAEKTIGSLSYGAALSSQEYTSTVFTGQSGHSEDAIQAHQRGFIPIAGYDQIFPPILYTKSGFPSLWCPIDQQQQSPFPVSSSHFSSSEIINSERSCHPCEETTNPSAEQTVGEEVDNSKSMESLVHGSPTPGLSDIGSFCNGIANKLNSGASEDRCIGSLCNGIANKLNSGASEDRCNESDSPTTPVGAAVRTRVSESVNDNNFLIHDSVGGTDSHCSSLREAALVKFRMKRKDRCYEKKVRYQSRKRLAEQRPRVKGQFVRQVQIDPACPEF